MWVRYQVKLSNPEQQPQGQALLNSIAHDPLSTNSFSSLTSIWSAVRGGLSVVKDVLNDISTSALRAVEAIDMVLTVDSHYATVSGSANLPICLLTSPDQSTVVNVPAIQSTSYASGTNGYSTRQFFLKVPAGWKISNAHTLEPCLENAQPVANASRANIQPDQLTRLYER